MALTHPYAAVGGQALEFFARLLARHGHAAQAYQLLDAGIEDWVLATALVDVAELAGLDDDAARLLSERVPGDHRCDSPWCCRGGLDADTALGLLARIRERQGRTDEAIGQVVDLQADQRAFDEGQFSVLVESAGAVGEPRVEPVPALGGGGAVSGGLGRGGVCWI